MDDLYMTRGSVGKPVLCHGEGYVKYIYNKKQRASLALTIDEGQGRKDSLVALYLYKMNSNDKDWL